MPWWYGHLVGAARIPWFVKTIVPMLFIFFNIIKTYMLRILLHLDSKRIVTGEIDNNNTLFSFFAGISSYTLKNKIRRRRQQRRTLGYTECGRRQAFVVGKGVFRQKWESLLVEKCFVSWSAWRGNCGKSTSIPPETWMRTCVVLYKKRKKIR